MYDTVINDVPLKDREDFDLGLFEVEREDELREWLSDTYMNSLKTVAASSAKQKEIASLRTVSNSVLTTWLYGLGIFSLLCFGQTPSLRFIATFKLVTTIVCI